MSQQQTRGASARAVVVGNAKSGYGLHKSGDKLAKSSSGDLNAEAMTCPKNTRDTREKRRGSLTAEVLAGLNKLAGNNLISWNRRGSGMISHPIFFLQNSFKI
jgi:hypothetical protein